MCALFVVLVFLSIFLHRIEHGNSGARWPAGQGVVTRHRVFGAPVAAGFAVGPETAGQAVADASAPGDTAVRAMHVFPVSDAGCTADRPEVTLSFTLVACRATREPLAMGNTPVKALSVSSWHLEQEPPYVHMRHAVLGMPNGAATCVTSLVGMLNAKMLLLARWWWRWRWRWRWRKVRWSHNASTHPSASTDVKKGGVDQGVLRGHAGRVRQVQVDKRWAEAVACVVRQLVIGWARRSRRHQTHPTVGQRQQQQN